MVQTNHAGIGCFGIDLDGRIVATRVSTPSEARNNLGSRKSATPAATLDGAQEVSTWALNVVGSSRLMAWPVLGQIHRPALGRVDLSIRLVSRQLTSSSPTASSTGTVISEN